MEFSQSSRIALFVVPAILSLWCLSALAIRRKATPILEQLQQQLEEVENFLPKGSYIRHSQKTCLMEKVEKILQKTTPPWGASFMFPKGYRKIQEFRRILKNTESRIEKASEAFVKEELRKFATFFDSVESKPLTEAQRRACVINDDRNLVFAGAGTGKTSTMIGRAGYLLASEQCSPEEILMLAFGGKASEEMKERQEKRLGKWLSTKGDILPTIETFHALGGRIIEESSGRKYDVTPLAEDNGKHLLHTFIERNIQNRCEYDEAFRWNVIKYYGGERYPYKSPFDFQSMEEYREYICSNEIMTLKGECVKSFEECLIANFLNIHGVKYKYEAPYEYSTYGPDYRQYKPDFYLEEYGIYLEHFALNREGNPPKHFDQQKYLQGVRWKRALHRKNQTILLETYSYLKREGNLETYLEDLLKEAGVSLALRSGKEILEELNTSFITTELAELFGSLLKLFKESGYDKKSFEEYASENPEGSALIRLMEIFYPVYEAYENELQEKKQIDFSDMIMQATAQIDAGSFISPYKHILIDEFQDISKARMGLVMALIRHNPETRLFAVGDDWQSIYRFAGSDISYMRDFEKHYGPAAKITLDTTFRFNNIIGDVASSFIMKNPGQVKKDISSVFTTDHPAIFLIPAMDVQEVLSGILREIQSLAEGSSHKKSTVLILGRYNYSLKEYPLKKRDFPGLDIKCMTMHGAKGKEADYVVVLDLAHKKFPSQKSTHPIIESLLPEKETFPFAEERRLFYVALTRARHEAYLLYDPEKTSSFIRELLKERDPQEIFIQETEPMGSYVFSEIPCPKCLSGILQVRKGKNGNFAGCSNYPYCTYTSDLCPQCGSIMAQEKTALCCANPSCCMQIPICPLCGGKMKKRTGSHGEFWGCSNYRGNEEFSCRHKIGQLTWNKKNPKVLHLTP